MKKGQLVRLLIGNKVVGAAKEMELTFNVQVEDITHKDVDDDWQLYQAISTSYQITSSALVLTHNDDLYADAYQLGDGDKVKDTPVAWKIANVSGTNNRDVDSVICSGSALITQLDINAQYKSNSTFTTTLNGVGEMVVGS